MLLLLSNDDGIEAPGLTALAAALAGPDVELEVVAPRQEQSAKSHALTMYEPLRVEEHVPRGAPTHGVRWRAVSGTPADCVYIGVHHLCARRPDAVLSGINFGTNLSDDVHYSGTVAAAMEGALMGIPAIAVSLGTGDRDPGDPCWETAAEIARRVLVAMLADPLPRHTFINLNVPGLPLDRIAGVRTAPMGKRYYHALVQANRDPRGRFYYWIGGPHDRFEGWELVDREPTPAEEPDHDGVWHSRGYATLTPLHPDLTAWGSMSQVGRWDLHR